MADAVSRLTRGKSMGAFCMQHGPGAENAYGGVAQAYADSVPILVVPQGYARKNMFLPYNYNSTLQMKGISKHCEPILLGAETPHVMRRAFTQLRNGRRSRWSSKCRSMPSTTKCRSRWTTPRLRDQGRAGPGHRGQGRQGPGRGEEPGDPRRPGRALGRVPMSSCRSSPSCWAAPSARRCRARAPSTSVIRCRWAPVVMASTARCGSSSARPTSSSASAARSPRAASPSSSRRAQASATSTRRSTRWTSTRPCVRSSGSRRRETGAQGA